MSPMSLGACDRSLSKQVSVSQRQSSEEGLDRVNAQWLLAFIITLIMMMVICCCLPRNEMHKTDNSVWIFLGPLLSVFFQLTKPSRILSHCLRENSSLMTWESLASRISLKINISTVVISLDIWDHNILWSPTNTPLSANKHSCLLGGAVLSLCLRGSVCILFLPSSQQWWQRAIGQWPPAVNGGPVLIKQVCSKEAQSRPRDLGWSASCQPRTESLREEGRDRGEVSPGWTHFSGSMCKGQLAW